LDSSPGMRHAPRPSSAYRPPSEQLQTRDDPKSQPEPPVQRSRHTLASSILPHRPAIGIEAGQHHGSTTYRESRRDGQRRAESWQFQLFQPCCAPAGEYCTGLRDLGVLCLTLACPCRLALPARQNPDWKAPKPPRSACPPCESQRRGLCRPGVVLWTVARSWPPFPPLCRRYLPEPISRARFTIGNTIRTPVSES
jgi:hypothetical protein